MEQQGQLATWARGQIMLTTHHLNHHKHDSRRKNLKAMCQRCHLRCDAPMRAERRKLAEDQASGQTRMWPLREWP